jgi:hypothetical protein
MAAKSTGHAQAYNKGFDFFGSKHEGSELIGLVERVTDTGLAKDGNAGKREIANITIDSAFGDVKQLSKSRGSGEPPRAEVLHDLEEPVCSAHSFICLG